PAAPGCAGAGRDRGGQAAKSSEVKRTVKRVVWLGLAGLRGTLGEYVSIGLPRGPDQSAFTSAELFSVSTTLTLSRRAGFMCGSRRLKAANATFSAVGMTPRMKSTSRFMWR